MEDKELQEISLTKDDLKELGGFIGEGTHKVTIVSAKFDKNASGKPFLGVDVKDAEGNTATARLWFVGGATPYSVNTVRRIFVHNEQDEAKKQVVRDWFKGLGNLLDFSKLAEKLTDKECWLTVEKTDETYTDKDGNEKNSYERNIWGYEPKPREKSNETSHKDVIIDDIDDKPIDLSEIPF